MKNIQIQENALIDHLILSRICYTELNLLLIAIESGIRTTKEKLRLNPQHATIGLGTTGFFIAQSPEEVRR